MNPGHFLIACIAVCLFAASCVAPEPPVRGSATINPINQPCPYGAR